MEHLLKPGGFFDITRDHYAYYDKRSLNFLLEKNGFEIVEFGEVSKLYIYAIVKKKKPYDLERIWSDVDILEKRIISFVNHQKENNNKIAIWCAGHYTFTILSLTGIGSEVSYIIDNAVYKQGRHVPIYGPEHFIEDPVDTIMILGPIYVDEIVREIRKKCSDKVSIVTIEGEEVKKIDW